MFRLIKILNSGVNVPEPMILKKPSSLTVKAGAALCITDGYVEICTATTAPTHIALRSADTGSSEVCCYSVNENMLFETTVNADPSALFVGAKVTLGQDSDSCTTCVTATTASGVATIVDLMNASKSGDKITVKF